MLGIIASITTTFEVDGMFSNSKPIEGHLYVDDATGRIFYYSQKENRSNPTTGYFPIWNGKDKIITSFSNEKYLSKDVLVTDIDKLITSIDKDIADKVIYQQKRSDTSDVLRPILCDGDNMFTQCIKCILNLKDYTIMDLVDMSSPKLSENVINNYYSALNKITFMRLDKWFIWIDIILHLSYRITIYDDGNEIITYDHPSHKFQVKRGYSDIVKNKNDDALKKIIKIIMRMKNVNKDQLKCDDIDAYTINNMITTLNSNKPLSCQIFSRFIRLIDTTSYQLELFENDKSLFIYRES